MSVDTPAVAARLLRVFAALAAIGAVVSWITPRNVAGKNLMPFGCGAPASPTRSEIADFVCADALASAKTLSVALIISAGVLLVISEVLVPRFWPRAWVRGMAFAAPVAVPLMGAATVRLLSTAGTVGADGTLVRCGTPIAPARDAISRYVCGQLADTERNLGIGGLALGVVLLVGGIYIASAWQATPKASTGDGPGEVTDAVTTAEPSPAAPGTGPTSTAAPFESGTGHVGESAPSTPQRWESR